MSVEKPQLPNNDDKIPFVIATPLHHFTNGSDQPVGVTLALNLIDKMRVIGYNSSDIPGSDQPVGVTLALNLIDKMRVIGYNSSDIPGTSTLAPFQQQGNAFMPKEKLVGFISIWF